MPNRTEHVCVAVPSGIALSIVTAPQGIGPVGIWEVFGGAVGAVPGALLPDIIDEPSCPNHRSFAHGAAPVSGLACLAWKHLGSAQGWLRDQADRYSIAKQTATSPCLAAWYGLVEAFLHFLVGALAGFVAGYMSHVIMDFQTPTSLPLVC